VIDEKILADGRTRMDLDPREEPGNLRDEPRDKRNTEEPNEVRHPVQKDGIETGVKRQFPPTGSGITSENGFEVAEHEFFPY
jgi:hypothetical protein